MWCRPRGERGDQRSDRERLGEAPPGPGRTRHPVRRFGTLESEVDFDAGTPRETLESAREDFDAAGRAARLDSTGTEVENLVRLTEVLLTAVEV
ncbi:MAG TPA: hypothetical protein VKA37_07325, partial [Halobacteriales archaeon]|nr:hypothetical protein [Halobacteriales archaeon]